MKTFTALGLLALTILTASVPGHATDRDGRYIIIGLGLEPCATQVTPYGLHLEAITWSAGFLSAYNNIESDTYDITAFNKEWDSWIAEYCRLNPQLPLAKAVRAYTITAYPTRTISKPAVVTPILPQQRAVKNRNRY